MYSEDPRNRKAPSLLLGFIAITGALILALFLTGILKANADDLIEPPHDPMFNNIVFITMTNDYMYVGGDTIIEMYEGASDGQYAQVWKSNFVQAINNFFSYVPKDQCFIVVASDGASANYMTSIREVLTSVSAKYWSGSQDGNFEANDFSGYEDLYAPAGMYNVRYKSRLVKYLPVSPTPTPTGPVPGEGFDYKYRWDNAYNYLSVNYPDYEVLLIYGSAIQDPYPMSAFMVPDSDYNSSAVQSISDGYFNPHYPEYNCGQTTLYEIEFVYDISSESITSVTSGPSSRSLKLTVTGNPLNYTFYGYNIAYKPAYYTGSLWTSSFEGRLLPLWDFGSVPEISSGPEPSASPEPTATPEPLPTSSESVHVILPTGTPTPTPPFSVPGNSGTGSGTSGSGSLSPGQIDSTLDTFKTYTENNNAFAFLYACTSVIPDEALYFLFILLFILLLLACIRLFVHFTG